MYVKEKLYTVLILQRCDFHFDKSCHQWECLLLVVAKFEQHTLTHQYALTAVPVHGDSMYRSKTSSLCLPGQLQYCNVVVPKNIYFEISVSLLNVVFFLIYIYIYLVMISICKLFYLCECS